MQDWREIVTYFSYPKRERDYSRWPDTPEGWRSVTEEYSDKVMGLAGKLMEVLSEAMGLEKEGLSKACVDMDQKVVVNYYPKCPQPDLTLGLKRHTDPGTITLLLQDQVGGLQATRDNGKTWITVQPVEAAFVVNLGDHAHVSVQFIHFHFMAFIPFSIYYKIGCVKITFVKKIKSNPVVFKLFYPIRFYIKIVKLI